MRSSLRAEASRASSPGARTPRDEYIMVVVEEQPEEVVAEVVVRGDVAPAAGAGVARAASVQALRSGAVSRAAPPSMPSSSSRLRSRMRMTARSGRRCSSSRACTPRRRRSSRRTRSRRRTRVVHAHVARRPQRAVSAPKAVASSPSTRSALRARAREAIAHGRRRRIQETARGVPPALPRGRDAVAFMFPRVGSLGCGGPVKAQVSPGGCARARPSRHSRSACQWIAHDHLARHQRKTERASGKPRPVMGARRDAASRRRLRRRRRSSLRFSAMCTAALAGRAEAPP